MMTREDMLRELELLPVWRLRSPELAAKPVTTAPDVQAEAVAPIAAEPIMALVAPAPANQIVVEASPELAVEAASAIVPVLVRYIQSSDADWLFILPASPLAADAELLLKNIFNAMRLKPSPISVPVAIADLKQTPKMMVALGEPVAQALLQTDASLQQLRGKLHQTADGTPLLASYDVAQLLTEVSYKPMMWADLCLAMQALKV